MPADNDNKSLPHGCLPRGLSRVQAAAYAGVGVTKFDQLVKDGRMPAPARLDGRVLWDRLALDRALDRLFAVTNSADEWSLMMRLLKYVHAFVDRNGHARHYFRRHGKRIALPGLPGSSEFMAAYQAALDDAIPAQIGAKRTKPGSVNAALVSYYTSLEFRSLAAGTQGMRRAILERFRAKHGDKSIAGLHTPFLIALLGKMQPHAAKNWLKAIRHLCQFSVANGMIAADPTRDVRLPRTKSDGHHTWTESEIAQFEATHPIGSKARLALALVLYSGQRVSDVVPMGRQHVSDDLIQVRQQKTRTSLRIPIHPVLQAVLDATPSSHLTFLVTRRERPYSPSDFSEQFRVGAMKQGCRSDHWPLGNAPECRRRRRRAHRPHGRRPHRPERPIGRPVAADPG